MAIADKVGETGAAETADQVLTQFFDAWQAHDVERVVSFFSPDGAYLASAGPDDDGTAFRGIAEVRRGVSAFLGMYPDARYRDVRVVTAGDRAFASWTFHGTRDGIPVSYRGVDWFEFDRGKIRLKDAFRKERTRPIE